MISLTPTLFASYLCNPKEDIPLPSLSLSDSTLTHSINFSFPSDILSFIHNKFLISISDRILHSSLSDENLVLSIQNLVIDDLNDHIEVESTGTESEEKVKERVSTEVQSEIIKLLKQNKMLQSEYKQTQKAEKVVQGVQEDQSKSNKKDKDNKDNENIAEPLPSPSSSPTPFMTHSIPPPVTTPSSSTSSLLPPASLSSSSALSSSLLSRLSAESEEVSPIHPQDLRLMVKSQFNDINIRDINIKVEGRELLTLATLHIKKHHHYGLVSRNGLGKSTLLRRIATHKIGGFPAQLIVSMMKQEERVEDYGEKRGLQVVIEGDKERIILIQKQKEIIKQIEEYNHNHIHDNNNDKKDSAVSDSVPPVSSPHDDIFSSLQQSLEEITDRLHFIQADTIEKRAIKILEDTLQVDPSLYNKKMKEMSGGGRMKIRLAAALLMEPLWLLLDEPTNCLDVQSIRFLIHFLRRSRHQFTSIIVSHDRFFLSAVTTDIIYLHNNSLHYYPTNFEGFLQAKDEKRKKEEKQQAALESKREHMKSSMEKLKKQAKEKGHGEMNMGMIASRKKKLGRMGLEKTEDGKKFNAQSHGRRIGSQWDTDGGFEGNEAYSVVDYDEKEMEMSFGKAKIDDISANVDETIMSLQNITLAFDNVKGEGNQNSLGEDTDRTMSILPLFHDLNFSLSLGKKIGIVGVNGIGKSLFLRLLYNDPSLSPLLSSGHCHWKKNLRVGYFHQHQVDTMPLHLTPLQYYHSVYGQSTEEEARKSLSRVGIKKELCMKPLGLMSGGEKTRVAIAIITAHTLAPHCLLLDEISNNLDASSLDHLVQAIKNYNGTVIMISHDQYFVDASCEEWWVMEKNEAQGEGKKKKNKNKNSKKGGGSGDDSDEDDGKPKSQVRIRRLNCTYGEYLNQMYGEIEMEDGEGDEGEEYED